MLIVAGGSEGIDGDHEVLKYPESPLSAALGYPALG